MPVYVLGSGREASAEETEMLAELGARYHLSLTLAETAPYELRIERLSPR